MRIQTLTRKCAAGWSKPGVAAKFYGGILMTDFAEPVIDLRVAGTQAEFAGQWKMLVRSTGMPGKWPLTILALVWQPINVDAARRRRKIAWLGTGRRWRGRRRPATRRVESFWPSLWVNLGFWMSRWAKKPKPNAGIRQRPGEGYIMNLAWRWWLPCQLGRTGQTRQGD